MGPHLASVQRWKSWTSTFWRASSHRRIILRSHSRHHFLSAFCRIYGYKNVTVVNYSIWTNKMAVIRPYLCRQNVTFFWAPLAAPTWATRRLNEGFCALELQNFNLKVRNFFLQTLVFPTSNSGVSKFGIEFWNFWCIKKYLDEV